MPNIEKGSFDSIPHEEEEPQKEKEEEEVTSEDLLGKHRKIKNELDKLEPEDYEKFRELKKKQIEAQMQFKELDKIETVKRVKKIRALGITPGQIREEMKKIRGFDKKPGEKISLDETLERGERVFDIIRASGVVLEDYSQKGTQKIYEEYWSKFLAKQAGEKLIKGAMEEKEGGKK